MTKLKNREQKWLPVGMRVMLKPRKQEKEEKKTDSGIIIPDSVASEDEKKSPVATVVAVSPELSTKWASEDPTAKAPIAEGDTVIYSTLGVDKIKTNGELFVIAPIENVLAKLT